MLTEKPGSGRRKARRIFALLENYYPLAKTGLVYNNPFELLVATVLSAQTTDEQVNRITEKLFAAAPIPHKMAELEPALLELYLRGCGIFRQKSRYLIEASRLLVDQHGGRVPESFEELVKLPGVGRKTANVILSNAFGQAALAVDTHVFRVSRRLGLAGGTSVEQVEQQLKEKLPRGEWGTAHHRLIAHGREICKARRPQCAVCFLQEHCPSAALYINRKGEG